MSNTSVFDSAVPRRLQYSLTKSVLENCRQSSRYCYRELALAQARDLSGHLCRAKIEDEMVGIAALFPMLRVTIKNYQNNTGSYNEITCGIVKLTQSRILNPNDVPRGASFRATLAANLLARFPDLRAEYLPSATVLSQLRRRRLRAQAGA